MRSQKRRKEGGHFPLPFRSLTFLSFSYLTSVQSLTLGVPYFTTNQLFSANTTSNTSTILLILDLLDELQPPLLSSSLIILITTFVLFDLRLVHQQNPQKFNTGTFRQNSIKANFSGLRNRKRELHLPQSKLFSSYVLCTG